MPTKKSAKKKTAAAKKKPAKKAVAKKAVAKKTPAKKVTVKKVAKKSPAKKTAARKAPAKKAKAPAKKVVKKKVATKKATAKKATAKKAKAPAKKAGSRKPKASDFIKRPSHTPAIFKTQSKRAAHILFTMEEVREALKKRAKEEKPAKKAAKKAKTPTKKPVKVEPKIDQHVSKHQAASLDDILGISPSAGSQKSGPGNVPRKFQKYHRLLIELRDHVREELNLHSNDTLKRSQKEDAGDISISVDAGTDNFDRDFALSLLSSEQESLNEIEAAIQRIYNGSYGKCEVTGEPIKPERLEAVPFTRFSLEGQREHEMTSYKRASRAGAFLNEASGETISFGDDDGDN